MSNIPKRNIAGQPFGIEDKQWAEQYRDGILEYYKGRRRRFNVSMRRLQDNFKKDLEAGRKQYSKKDIELISELREMDSNDMKASGHIEWIKKAMNQQKTMENSKINLLTKELVDEFDYILASEVNGFLNDEGYQCLRNTLIVKIEEVYEEKVKFLGVILRSIVLSSGLVKW